MDCVRGIGELQVCMGCLSIDRALQLVSEDIKTVYYSFTNEKIQKRPLLFLCWECTANVRKLMQFKNKCLQAYNTLNKLMVPTSITSLSNLIIVQNHIKININCKDEEFPLEKFHPKQFIDCFVENTHKKQNNEIIHPHTLNVINHEVILTPRDHEVFMTSKEDEVNLSPKIHENDIPFVKVEENIFGGAEGFADDGFSSPDVDFKNFSTVLNTDYVSKTKIKYQAVKKDKKEDDFNDSDEEPLYIKSTKTKKNKHKKKKDQGISEGVGSKITYARREKPAGVVKNSRVAKKLQQLNVAEGHLEMVVLSWDEVEQERQRAVTSIVFTRHEYRCYDCIIGFNHKFKLENHMNKHDPSSGDMECEVCKVRCKDSHALSAHRRRHRVRWRCCFCGDVWSRASVAADHCAREHRATLPTHTCSVCGHAESTLGKLRNHMKNHAERQKCDLCGKTFRDRTSLRTHLFIHRGVKEYSCEKCDKRFLFKKAMEVHLVTHEAPAHLYCYQCDMNFKNRMSFTQHMKYSLKHIDPDKLKYACKLCDKKFVKAIRLEEHNLAVHLKVTPIHCTLPGCNFACSSRPVLRTHTRMVHRNARIQRNHVCHTCGKTYTTKKTLEGHMRSHTGERPFKCLLCPSTFGYEAALYNHNKLVHLNTKINKRTVPLRMPIDGEAKDLS